MHKSKNPDQILNNFLHYFVCGNISIACLIIYNCTLRNVLNFWLLILHKYMEF